MDCHRCENIRYDGNPYGHCIHRGHPDVVLKKGKGGSKSGSRPYNRQICPDFVIRKRCSNCAYWERGEYFRDGRTPASKGKCSLKIVERNGHDCPLWKPGPTKWRRKAACPRAATP